MIELTPDLALKAYSVGLFPMSESKYDSTIFWVDPDKRGILPFDHFHISHSLRKILRKHPFTIKANAAFDDVIEACAAPRKIQKDTWINPEIAALFKKLHQLGFAHSIEVWDKDKLIGGLYGIALHGAFFGESMFSRQKDASKVALTYLVAHLQQQGFILLDTQFVTEHLRRLGAIEIAREDYLLKLEEALQLDVQFLPGLSVIGSNAGAVEFELAPDSVDGILQSTTQIS